jgi:phosphonate transport system substrate-binding protein
MITIGAVAYDPRVVPIWEGMRDYFKQAGMPIDYVLFSNYEAQVQALLDNKIDIAWNTNLAWIKVHHRTNGKCRALAMRDVDADYKTVFVARTDKGIETLQDLKGKRVALGSADSAQAAILPLHWMHEAGLDAERDCKLLRYDLDVGKHGDTGSSEIEVLRALREGLADAGAIGDATWARELSEGRVDSRLIKAFWTSPGYAHCNFTVLDSFSTDVGERWTEKLLEMTYDDPQWRPLMDQEGLKRWIRPQMDGYTVLFDAVHKQGVPTAAR